MIDEAISDIRNKFQPLSVVLERMAEGKAVPESFIRWAIRDFMDAWKLFQIISTDGEYIPDFIISK